ncbi:MAG TPA: ankyrin repeat domain-containing protein [Candidatus Babeliaceae bacterium]|nr:ankyrin repeat domain-containing protein [Candidatus Babeliaceae bacterium]
MKEFDFHLLYSWIFLSIISLYSNNLNSMGYSLVDSVKDSIRRGDIKKLEKSKIWQPEVYAEYMRLDFDDQSTPLHFAVCHFDKGGKLCENIAAIELLLNNKVDPNVCEFKGMATPLHFALSAQAVNLLVNAGASVNKGEQQGLTPLHSAVRRGRLEVVKAIIDHKAEVNAETYNHETPLFFAQSYDILDTLLQNGACVNHYSKSGSKPIHEIIKSSENPLSLVVRLLSSGNSPNELKKDNEPIIVTALKHRRFDVVTFLVGQKLDIKEFIGKPHDPLRLGAIELGARKEHKNTPNHEKYKEYQDYYKATGLILERLFQEDSDFAAHSFKDETGNTFLHWAVRFGKEKIVDNLLELGADITKISNGKTPIILARELGQENIYQKLSCYHEKRATELFDAIMQKAQMACSSRGSSSA